MAATPDTIPTDLSIEMGDDVSPGEFMRACQAFFGYITEISKSIGDGEVPKWRVQVRESSNLLGVYPAGGTLTPWHRSVTAKAERGYKDLARGNIEASGLTDLAIYHLNVLSQMASGPREHPTYLQLWFERKPVLVDAAIAGVIREDELLGYSDYGTIEGILDTVQDRRRKLQLRITDPALHQAVKVYVSENQLADALLSFRQRVEVSGVIHYRKNGQPITVRAEKIEQLPSDDELPTWEDVQGIFRDSA